MDIFLKGLSHGFVLKVAILPTFLMENRPKHVFYDNLKQKNTFLGYKYKKIQTTEKLTFFLWG